MIYLYLRPCFGCTKVKILFVSENTNEGDIERSSNLNVDMKLEEDDLH
jgi:hypothetical protein